MRDTLNSIQGEPDLRDWFEQAKQHQLTQFIELVEQAKLVCRAAEELPEEKIKQFLDTLIYDLHEFYLHHQKQAKYSVYLGLLQESFWDLLVNITDKAQVEWAERAQDFHHYGDYQKGDLIGFGLLVCKQCQNSLLISHISEVDECIHCGHEHFFRQSLNP